MYAANSVSVTRCKFKNYNPYIQASTHIYLLLYLLLYLYMYCFVCCLMSLFIDVFVSVFMYLWMDAFMCLWKCGIMYLCIAIIPYYHKSTPFIINQLTKPTTLLYNRHHQTFALVRQFIHVLIEHVYCFVYCLIS